MSFEQWISLEPMAAPRHRARRIGRGIAFYHVKEYTDWLDECRALYTGPQFDCPVDFTNVHYIRRPASVKRPYPSVKPDDDNYLKALQDALTGVAWADDSTVIGGPPYKLYADDCPPGIYIKIREFTGLPFEVPRLWEQ